MLTLYPRLNVPPSDMQRRGRSRQVSLAALARHASEERRRRAEECIKEYFRVTAPPLPPSPPPAPPPPPPPPPAVSNATSRSPSPYSSSSSTSASMSPDSYDTTTTAPTLEDQVHIAYALDDIHLAKILLLRLKGIEVTSDDDPRIAAVQDEDFDICFVPAGRLLDEEDEKAVLEAQRKEREKWEESRRAENLRVREKIWEDEKRRMRLEKLNLLRRKEAQALAVAEQRKREEEERRRARAAVRYSRGLVSYTPSNDGVDQFSGKEDKPLAEDFFRYSYMIPSTSPKIPKLSLPSPSLTYGNCVSFKNVLASMNGPLFPSATSHSPLRPHARAHDRDLFDSLLKVVQWEDGERRRIRGKGKRAPRLRVSRVDSCAACSATSPTSSSSSSSSGSSWRFGSRSSVSTAATSLLSASPSSCSSPLSSWLNPSSPTLTASPVSDVSPSLQLRHSCRSRLTSVDPAECPLGSAPVVTRQRATVDQGRSRGFLGRLELDLSLSGLGISIADTTESVEGEKGSRMMRRVSRSVSSFVDLAKGIQTAYISATVLSVATSSESVHEKDLYVNENMSGGNGEKKTGTKLRPPGYRVHPSSISIFSLPNIPTSAPGPDHALFTAPAPIYIPLVPFSSATGTVASPRTRLSAPIPLQFPPPLTPPRSPLRPREPPPPGSVLWRMRPVGNPVLLRLRALRNVLWERGVGWEGKGREGGLGAGKERLCRVAVEGRGRSRLGSVCAGGYVGVCG